MLFEKLNERFKSKSESEKPLQPQGEYDITGGILGVEYLSIDRVISMAEMALNINYS